MKDRRGDVVLGFYQYASGVGGKRRPVLIVQNDRDNRRMSSTVVAQITSTLDRASEPTHLLILASSVEGKAAGLLHDSVVSCNNLATLSENRIDRVIGRSSPATMSRIDTCLKPALDLS